MNWLNVPGWIIVAAACLTAACASERAHDGLVLNEAEKQRFKSEYIQANLAKESIRQIAADDKMTEVTSPPPNKTLSGMSIVVTEHAHDGTYTVQPEVPAKADANSTLIVQFDVPKLAKIQNGLPSARWQRVTGILGRAEDLAKSRAALNAAEVDLNSSEQVAQLKKRAQAEDKKITDLYSDLEQLGLDQKTIRSILSGGFRNVSMSLGHLPVAFSVAPRLSTS